MELTDNNFLIRVIIHLLKAQEFQKIKFNSIVTVQKCFEI